MEFHIADGARVNTITYQQYWEDPVSCKYCGKPSKLILVIDDAHGELCKAFPEIYHDSIAIALYACKECTNITALYNLA